MFKPVKLLLAIVAVCAATVSAQDYSLISNNASFTASSEESWNHGPKKLNDGSMSSRWSSKFYDGQWIRIDLGKDQPIDKIVLYWETAHASEYEVYGSKDGASIQTQLIDKKNSNGGIEEYVQSYGEYRYLMINLERRATSWGFSLFEIELFSKEKATTLVDSRDGKEYNITEINGITWMAENLNYSIPQSGSETFKQCYADFQKNCKLYGALYSQEDVADVCPDGWKLPSENDWQELTDYVADNNVGLNGPGYSLKTAYGWDTHPQGGGNDAYGFAALPAGTFDGNQGFIENSQAGIWWSSQMNSNVLAETFKLNYENGYTVIGSANPGQMNSIRCIQDDISFID